MSKLKNFVTVHRKIILAATVLLLAASLLGFQGLTEDPYSFKDNSKVEEYNNVVEEIETDYEDLSLEELINSFSKIDRLSDPESFVAVASKHNVAYLLASYSNPDVEKLRVARHLLVEALRIVTLNEEYQTDEIDEGIKQDIVKNLDLITAALIQQVAEELQESGMPEEQAEEAAKEQEIGEMPSSGPEPSRGTRNEQDY